MPSLYGRVEAVANLLYRSSNVQPADQASDHSIWTEAFLHCSLWKDSTLIPFSLSSFNLCTSISFWELNLPMSEDSSKIGQIIWISLISLWHRVRWNFLLPSFWSTLLLLSRAQIQFPASLQISSISPFMKPWSLKCSAVCSADSEAKWLWSKSWSVGITVSLFGERPSALEKVMKVWWNHYCLSLFGQRSEIQETSLVLKQGVWSTQSVKYIWCKKCPLCISINFAYMPARGLEYLDISRYSRPMASGKSVADKLPLVAVLGLVTKWERL